MRAVKLAFLFLALSLALSQVWLTDCCRAQDAVPRAQSCYSDQSSPVIAQAGPDVKSAVVESKLTVRAKQPVLSSPKSANKGIKPTKLQAQTKSAVRPSASKNMSTVTQSKGPDLTGMSVSNAIAKGKALVASKKHKEAIHYFTHAIKTDAKSAQAFLLRAESQRQLAQYEQAADDYLRYTQLYPQDSDGYLNLGQMYYKMGKKQQALFYLNRAVVLNVKNPFIYVQRANVYAALGKNELAADDRDLAKKLGFDGSDDTK